MAVEVSSVIKPLSGNNFAIVEAMDVEMPDGSRLSELDIAGTSEELLKGHNENKLSHADIRESLKNLNDKITRFLGTPQEDLDELSEILGLIADNKDLISGITTNKINYTDIVDNLESEDKNKVLSAKQGKELAAQLDGTLKLTEQNLSDTQKEIVRANIGAMSDSAQLLPEVGKTEENLLFSSGGEWIPISASRFARNSLDLTNLKVNPSTVEVGTQVDSVTISWTTNFPTNSATVNGKVIYEDRKGAGNYSHLDNNDEEGFKLTSKGNQSWKVKVNGDYNESDEGTISLSFIYKVYYGALDADGEINEEAIKTMSSKLMSNTNGDYSISPGANQKMALAAPSSYSQIKNVIINNNTYTWDKVGENIPVTSNGIVTNYNVWMNGKITTAPCTITVKV